MPTPWPRRARKFLRRHWRGLAVATALSAAIIAGVAGSLYQARQAAREARTSAAVREMLTELFSAADPTVAQGHHSPDMLMVYLPKEKILFNADLYSSPAPGAPVPMPNAATKTLMQNIRKLKLDVERHAAVHGPVGTHEQFMRMFAPDTRTN